MPPDFSYLLGEELIPLPPKPMGIFGNPEGHLAASLLSCSPLYSCNPSALGAETDIAQAPARGWKGWGKVLKAEHNFQAAALWY